MRAAVPARMLAQMPAQMPAQTVGTVLARTRLMRLLPMLTLARLVAMRLLPTRRPAMLRPRVMARWQTSPRCLVMLGCPMPARPPVMLRPRVMARRPVTPGTLATPRAWRWIWSALRAARAVGA